MTASIIEEPPKGRHHRLYSAIAFLIVIALIVLLLSQVLKADVLLPDNLTPMTANAELLIINPLPWHTAEQLCSINSAELSNPAFAYVVAERSAIMQIKNEWCLP